jgi:hypothetical protein
MRASLKSTLVSTLVLATALAIALTALDLRPAAAASEGGPAAARQNAVDELSAARKKRGRYRGHAFPFAAVGAIIGGIASVAAAQRAREVYYDDGYYAAPGYGPAPVYAVPEDDAQVYYETAPGYDPAPYAYGAPRYRHGHGYRQHAPYAVRAPHFGQPRMAPPGLAQPRLAQAPHFAPRMVGGPRVGGRVPGGNPNAKHRH